jgi:radical SAM family uncharacterized protein/radical SAM-linked protein
VNLLHFQKPSRYIDSEVNVIRKEGAPLRVALVFPDIYDVGMSHLGLRILYDIINALPYASAERVFHPWLDMDEAMKIEGIPLCSLESGTPLVSFDVVGFSLQYELSYTSVLNMLSLGGIPIRAEDRTGAHPIVMAGGPCTVNPAPMSPFMDAFLVGDGEAAVPEILEAVHGHKSGGRHSVLEALSKIDGVLVPSIKGAGPVTRRFIPSLEDSPYPLSPVLPYTEIVHDRINIEVSRGCTQGCRFCQAGMIYRPLRERSPDRVLEIAEASLKSTGYEEVAFTSLSAGDYSALLPLLKRFNRKFSQKMLSVSLPSLRVKAVNQELLKEIRAVRKSGFTIAPEAATDRLRAAINKDFSEEDYERAVETLFSEGWQNLKLYFMIGLPGEREEDIEAIPEMVRRALKAAKRHTSRFVNLNVSVSPFVPKAHTPFQWCGQADIDYIRQKRDYLRGAVKKANIKGHDERMSMLEAAFARGDEGLSALIEAAWRGGAKLDGWSESFDFDRWLRAMDASGVDAFAHAKKEFGADEALPWDAVDTGIKKKHLRGEYEAALSGRITPECRTQCTSCGLKCEAEKPAAEAYAGPALRPLRPEPAPHRPIKVRARFSKTGKLRYLSHRELITHMTRAIKRAGVEVDYSKGFNPAPKISFGPPLGVGVSGEREYFDMEVLPGTALKTIRDRINAALTGDVRIGEIAPVGLKEPSLQAFVTRYVYEVACAEPEAAERFLERKEVLVERKKGVVDIRPMVEAVEAAGPDRVRLVLKDTAEKKVRLDEIMVAVFGKPALEFEVTRTAMFGYKRGWVEPLEEGSVWQQEAS